MIRSYGRSISNYGYGNVMGKISDIDDNDVSFIEPLRCIRWKKTSGSVNANKRKIDTENTHF